MSLYSNEASVVHAPFPGIEILDIGGGLEPAEFEEFAGGLRIPSHFDIQGSLVSARQALQLGQVMSASRSIESPRDPWALDHHWHSDRTYWGENPFASVLYAQQLVGRVAATGFIDTTLLLETIEADSPGLTEELADSEAVFSVGRYYKEVLPMEGSPEAIRRTLQTKEAKTLGQVAAAECGKYPQKTFPALPIHPLRGEHCTMIDDVLLVRLTNLPDERGRAIVRTVRENYLHLPPEELARRPYYALHEWEEGQVLIYPQVGTLHRAMPSPETELRRDTLRLAIV